SVQWAAVAESAQNSAFGTAQAEKSAKQNPQNFSASLNKLQ
ncbi:9834_t:CDS:1, partial [Gigaspora margarita]